MDSEQRLRILSLAIDYIKFIGSGDPVSKAKEFEEYIMGVSK